MSSNSRIPSQPSYSSSPYNFNPSFSSPPPGLPSSFQPHSLPTSIPPSRPYSFQPPSSLNNSPSFNSQTLYGRTVTISPSGLPPAFSSTGPTPSFVPPNFSYQFSGINKTSVSSSGLQPLNLTSLQSPSSLTPLNTNLSVGASQPPSLSGRAHFANSFSSPSGPLPSPYHPLSTLTPSSTLGNRPTLSSFSIHLPSNNITFEVKIPPSVRRQLEQNMKILYQMDAPPERYFSTWSTMNMTIIALQINPQMTLYVDPLTLSNFLQKATASQQSAAKDQLVQLTSNKSAPINESAKFIGASISSEIAHVAWSILGLVGKELDKAIDGASLLIKHPSNRADIWDDQIRDGHLKIDLFLGTTQAYKYDPDYKPTYTEVGIPFLPTIGLSLFGRVRQLTTLEGAAARTGDRAIKTLERLNIPSSKLPVLEQNISQWLGKETKLYYNKAGDPIFLSKDGLRKVRFDFNRPTPHESPHMHFESLVDGEWQQISRIYPIDVPHK